MTLTKKQIQEIEKIIGKPIFYDHNDKYPHLTAFPAMEKAKTMELKEVIENSNLDKSTKHEMQKVLETPMSMSPDDAVRVVRGYLNEHKNKR